MRWFFFMGTKGLSHDRRIYRCCSGERFRVCHRVCHAVHGHLWPVAAEVWDIFFCLEDDANLCLGQRNEALDKKAKQHRRKEAKGTPSKDRAGGGFQD